MTQAQLYGKLPSEKMAEENKVAREIVREISNFGVSDRQRWMIMYLLSLELENVNDMRAISSYIKEKKGHDLFVSSIAGEDV